MKWDEGHGIGGLDEEIQPRLVSCDTASKVWLLPRHKPADPLAPLVIHVINHDYDASRDRMVAKRGVQVKLREGLTAGRSISRVTLLRPEAKPAELALRREAGVTSLRIPELEMWGLLKVELET